MQFKRLAGMTLALMCLAGCAGIAPIDLTATAQATSGTTDANGTSGGDTQSDTLEGDVIVDGSSTVYPITAAVAEEFRALAPDVRVSVGQSGTGGGFEKFCAGITDISDASRAIQDGEAQACADNNIEYVEMLIGLDGLTVVVNPANDYADCLTPDQLAQLFGVNSTVRTWADLNPDWPAEPIRFYVSDPDSGTRDFMIEVLEDADEAATDIRQDEYTTNSGDDNVLLTGVANEVYALGFFGYAYFLEAGDQVRAVSIQNSDGDCIDPTSATIEGGEYNPLSRPLYLYVNTAALRDKPQVAAFVRYLNETGIPTIMEDVGYSLPPAGTLEDNLTRLDEVLGE